MAGVRRKGFAALSCVGLLSGVAALPGVPAAASGPVIVHGGRLPADTARSAGGGVRNLWEASNWSGYAETGSFAGVSGTWTVPAVSSSSGATYSATWVGVDGFDDDDLIQTGTEQDYSGGAAQYYAWWEILPAAETEISPSSYPVSPGNRMEADIYETTTTVTSGTSSSGFGRGSGRGTVLEHPGRGTDPGRGETTEHEWVITISDVTEGWSFTTDEAYDGPGTSAEWIVEAPEVNGRIATLAHYTITPPSGTGDFDNAAVATAEAPLGSPSFTAAGLNYSKDAGVMIQSGKQVSTPSEPDSADTAFDMAYGSAEPAAPTG